MANYCTLNPISSRYMTLSEGNLKAVSRASGDARIIGTIGVTSGKWYWEYTWTVGQHPGPTGVVSQKYWNEYIHSNGIDGIGGANAVGSYQYEGYSTTISGGGNTYTSAPSTISGGETVMIAFDVDNLKLWYGKNGTWFNSGDPANGSNPSVTMSGAGEVNQTWFPHFTDNYGGDTSGGTFNFGSSEFRYTPPTGFLAINTENLSEPTFSPLAAQSPSDHFKTVLYTGTGSTQSITGVGFQPDFLWIKARNLTNNHTVFDAVRGAGVGLFTNLTNSEISSSTYMTSFDSDGFTVETSQSTNGSGDTYVAWCWKAGGTPVSNTDGSITSSVSANTTAGFSIVSYTGNGTVGATVGHGLTEKPDMMIVKKRSSTPSAENWIIYHTSLGATKGTYLNLTDTPYTLDIYWNNTEPTSSVFSLKDWDGNNTSSEPYIAYCFRSVEGFSKIGSYTGNGSTDGPFINTGFKPGFILVKRTSTARNWQMMDNVRNPYNPVDAHLHPNLNNAEASANPGWYDSVSNGFKIRATWDEMNTSGETYIYMAFAEDPFKYNTAR